MGCGGSKAAADDETELPARPVLRARAQPVLRARAQPVLRPGRTGLRTGSHSLRSRTSTSSRSRSHPCLPHSFILEGDQATTPEVIAEIVTLQLSIENHSFNFYHHHSQVDVRRTIGMAVIGDIVGNNKDVIAVAQDLQNDLRVIATEPDDPRWFDHLYEICRIAARVGRKMSNHAETWSFGPWDNAMLFPEAFANGRRMVDPQYYNWL